MWLQRATRMAAIRHPAPRRLASYRVEVYMTRDVDKLGRVGQVVEVQPGYARNYLVPRGLAVYMGEGAYQKQVPVVDGAGVTKSQLITPAMVRESIQHLTSQEPMSLEAFIEEQERLAVPQVVEGGADELAATSQAAI